VKTYSAVIERDPETGLFVGFVPGFPGAHSQGATLDELNINLQEVIAMRMANPSSNRNSLVSKTSPLRDSWAMFQS
jgi:predicted RNase H-like HicB family nuclease